MKDALKLFGKKFASGASLQDSSSGAAGKEVVIQVRLDEIQRLSLCKFI
jgi:hypothetical protein